jgi:hypothetical protein
MGGVVRAIKKIVKTVVKAVTNVFSGFMGMFGMSFDTPDMGGGASYENEQRGITVNKQSNVAGVPVVYGKRKVGGTRVFVASSGSDNKYLYVCLAVAEGEINGFTRIYINDEEQAITSFPTNNNSTVNVLNGSKYFVNGTSRAQFQFFRGTEDQSASSLLKEHPSWTDNHRLRGVAYVAARYEWVKPEFANDGSGEQTLYNPWKGIPTIQVEIEGKKVLSGNYSSHGTTTSNTYGSETGSFTFSNNPADCLLDYLRNPRYGKGLSDNRIDWEEFRTSQVVCDTNANFGGSLGTADFLDCNIHLRTEDNLFQNTKKLLQSCRGFLPYVNGKYKLQIETAESTPGNLINLTDDMIIGSIKIQSPDKNAKYNEAHITYSNAEKQFESDTAIFASGVFKTEDDGEALILKMGAPGITSRERALQYAEYLVKRSRKQLQVLLTTTSEGQQLVAGDLVCITHSYEKQTSTTSNDRFGYLFKQPTSSSYSDPDKIFRVTSQKLNYDGTVDLVLLEHQNDIYAVTQQQEDVDLSAYGSFRQTQLPNILPNPVPSIPPAQTITGKHFTLTTSVVTIGGVKRPTLSINNNNYQNVDGNAVRVIYRIAAGSNVLVNPVTLPNRDSGFTFINGPPMAFNQTITVNISSEYRNGQINSIESHTVTMPPNPSATASGGI